MLDGKRNARRATSSTSIGALDVSPDDRLLAYTEDTVGRRQYTLRFKDLATGAMLPDAIAERRRAESPGRTTTARILYVAKDPVTLLGRACASTCSAPIPRRDPLVYEEQDESFYIVVDVDARTERYVLIYSREHDHDRSALRRRGRPGARASACSCRASADHEYEVDHLDDRLDHPHQLAGAELPAHARADAARGATAAPGAS